MPSAGGDLQAQIDALMVTFDRFPEIINDAAVKAFQVHGRSFENYMVSTRLRGRPGLARRSGDLARSFRYTVMSKGNRPVLRVWTTSKYAAIHERGGTIVPKKSKYLAIPVGPSLQPTGASKYSSPREIEGLIFMKKRGGKPFLARMNRDGKPIVYFLLRDKVVIMPRLGMAKSWKRVAPNIVPELRNAADTELAKHYPRTGGGIGSTSIL